MAKKLQNRSIIFIVVLTITSLLPVESAHDLVELTCQNTLHFILCDFILRNDPRSATADLNGLIIITIDSLTAKTDSIIRMIDQMLKDRPEQKIPLTECRDRYNAIRTYYIRDAIVAVNTGNPKLGEDMMFAAKESADECDEAFRPNPCPLVNINKLFYDISDIILGMFTQMKV